MPNQVVESYKRKYPSDTRSDDEITSYIGENYSGQYEGYEDFAADLKSLLEKQPVDRLQGVELPAAGSAAWARAGKRSARSGSQRRRNNDPPVQMSRGPRRRSGPLQTSPDKGSLRGKISDEKSKAMLERLHSQQRFGTNEEDILDGTLGFLETIPQSTARGLFELQSGVQSTVMEFHGKRIAWLSNQIGMPSSREHLERQGDYIRELEFLEKEQAKRGQDMAITFAAKREVPMTDHVKKWTKAKWGEETGKLFAQDPIQTITHILAESMGPAIPTLVGSLAGGPGGTLRGAGKVAHKVAQAAGVFTGSAAMDRATGVIEAAKDAGIDTTDGAAIAAAFSSPEKMRDWTRSANEHAVAVGAMDALSFHLSGKLIYEKIIPKLSKSVQKASSMSSRKYTEAFAPTGKLNVFGYPEMSRVAARSLPVAPPPTRAITSSEFKKAWANRPEKVLDWLRGTGFRLGLHQAGTGWGEILGQLNQGVELSEIDPKTIVAPNVNAPFRHLRNQSKWPPDHDKWPPDLKP